MTHAPAAGRITAIEPQERDRERVSVFLDGAFAVGLSLELAVREGLAVGDDLDETRVVALRVADEVGRATNAALNLLARRPRSQHEIRDRLRQKGFPLETIDAAIAKLEDWRYVDDADFARYWVDNRAANQPRGRRLLEQELRRKGVARDVVRQTLDQTDLDEAETALSLGRAKLRAYAGLEPLVVRRRLGSYLARRGYGYDVIGPVLDRLLGEADAPPEDVPSGAI